MNKFVLIVIITIALGAAALSGIFSLELNKNQNYKPVSPTAKCVDFDPPSTSNQVSYNGFMYDLIKNNAEVVEQAKFSEMKQVGQTPSGQGIYTEPGSNFFGQGSDSNLIFVLQNSGGKIESPYIFNIYLKDGVAIPNYIKNCKTTGGQMTIATGNQNAFPPVAFNKTDIIGLSDQTIPPAYVYNSGKTTLQIVNGLGAKMIGSLKVASKNANLPLYFHLGTMYLIDGNDAYEYLPSSDPIDLSAQEKKSLQLQKLVFVQTSNYSWWTPSCKPAIYLYPKTQENINVKVNTTGFLTLSIPDYPTNGWSVLANPNGEIKYKNVSYPYLYYESQVPDAKVKVSDKGFVVTREELPGLFDNLLPKLGLLPKESDEFKKYWQKALPLSPYYFVAIMDNESIENVEPLDINPKPDTLIRVRLYFQLLDKKIQKEVPVIETPKRIGFTAVEWGGMVKTDSSHPFTCSQ
ncbi:MAG: hypothetical protein M1450_03705 [Patescibacteria group bacterium]|nr:hypothetical protein [Patescibacteria group bacterium]